MKLIVEPHHAIGRGQLLWLVSGRIPGSDDDTAQLVLAPTDGDARDTFTDWMINCSNMDEDTEESLRADHGTVCYIIKCEQIGAAERPNAKNDLAQRLRDLAEGARSKADLIASGSPTSKYTNPVDVLRALAKEAEKGLAPDPDAGLEIQRTLLLSTAHLPVSHREWLDAENRCNQFCLWKVLPTALNQDEETEDATLIVDPISDYGWRICVTEAVEDFAAKVTSDDPLLNLLRFAEAHHCDWLAIDQDGDVVDGLPTFED